MLPGAVPVLPVLPVCGLQWAHIPGRASHGHARARTGDLGSTAKLGALGGWDGTRLPLVCPR